MPGRVSTPQRSAIWNVGHYDDKKKMHWYSADENLNWYKLYKVHTFDLAILLVNFPEVRSNFS